MQAYKRWCGGHHDSTANWGGFAVEYEDSDNAEFMAAGSPYRQRGIYNNSSNKQMHPWIHMIQYGPCHIPV
jgi:hypothetical protein